MSSSRSLRILLVEDHAIVRAGLRNLLESSGELQVVGEAADGQEAIRCCRRLNPDLVLMDLTLPKLSGIQAIKAIRQESEEVKILALTATQTEEIVHGTLAAGVSGFVSKADGVEVMLLAIENVMKGQTFLSPTISAQVVARYLQTPPGGRPRTKYETLTKREREVLQLVAEGSTTREIGQDLGISRKTAETHRANIMKKLDVHNAAALAKFATEMGILA